MAYTTAANVKTYLAIDGSGDDALIGTLIAAAQAAIDSYCRRTFEASTDTTRTFDALRDVERYVLFLDEDLAAITTVTNGDGVEVASDEYTTQPRNRTPYYALKILSSSAKTWDFDDDHEDAISIEGRWAYSTTAPDDIAQAATELAAFLYRRKDAAITDITAIEAGVVIQPQSIPGTVRALLNPYRRTI